MEYPISRVPCDARILDIFEGVAGIQAQVVCRGLMPIVELKRTLSASLATRRNARIEHPIDKACDTAVHAAVERVSPRKFRRIQWNWPLSKKN